MAPAYSLSVRQFCGVKREREREQGAYALVRGEALKIPVEFWEYM